LGVKVKQSAAMVCFLPSTMAHVISFKTSRFDVSKETPNPVNPIAGQSVLTWLRDELSKAQYQVTEPDTEDWGWYIEVEAEGAHYLVGASADARDPSPDVDWVVQVHKSRSLKDKLLGKNKLAADDPLSAVIETILRADSRFEEIAIIRVEA
jgi:hypothetical protein